MACQRPAHKAGGLLWEFVGGVEGVPKKLEHNDIRWITVEEIDELAFCPADEEILERLRWAHRH